jgi:hypothetical protein
VSNSGWLNPGTAAWIPASWEDWTDAANVGDGSESTYAHVTLPKNTGSDYIRVTNFPWPTLPVDAVLDGVEFRVRHYAESTEGGVWDYDIYTYSATTPSGDLADAAEWTAQTAETFTYGGPADTLSVVKADLDSDFGLEINVVGSVSAERTGRIYYIQSRIHWTSSVAIYEDAIDIDATAQLTDVGSLALPVTASLTHGHGHNMPAVQQGHGESLSLPLGAFNNSTGGFLYEDAAILAEAFALVNLADISLEHTVSLAMAGAQAADPLLNFGATLTLLLQGGQSTTNQAGLTAELPLPLQVIGTAVQRLDLAALSVLGHVGDAAATNDLDMEAMASWVQASGLSPANIMLAQAALAVGCEQAMSSANDINIPVALVLSLQGDGAADNDAAFNTLAAIHHSADAQTSQTQTLSLMADMGAVQALGALTQADLTAQAVFAGNLASIITDILKKRASARRTLKVPGGARTLTLTKR